jgi:putative N6-adenine-specific DNA methylase
MEGKDFRMVAKTMYGLEDVLVKELETIGAKNIEKLNRAVSFEGDMTMLYKANYLLRTAISILKPIYSFEANNEKELYDNVYKYKWEKLINCDGTLSIEPVVYSSIFTHSLYASQKTKDAICDRIRKMFLQRPTLTKDNPDIILNLHINENQVTISLDSSGESLHRRNYRLATEKAPINEVVAAGLIQLSGWERDTNFFDPMCGSGTIVIEAAMYAYNIPAQYYRHNFAFKKWADFSMPEYRRMRQQADKQIRDFDYEIWGSDISGSAIKTATENITNAKLHKDIELFRSDIQEQDPPEGKTLIITNPPYGQRIETDDLFDLYELIGRVFKNKYSGNTAWIISSDLDAFKYVGLRPSRKITIYNSNLECRFCKYELYEGSKKVSKQM